jgi:hypothetical protein
MDRRLDRIGKALGGDGPCPGQMVWVQPDDWPEDARAAFLAAHAAGDTHRLDDLVEVHVGRRPVRTGKHVALIIDVPYPDGYRR